MKVKELSSAFFKYTFANVISTLGVSVYILIDTFFISKGMGPNGLAALNLCLPVFSVINGLGLLFGMGGGSRYSMLYGQAERSETDRIFTATFVSAFAVSLVLMCLGLFASGSFAGVLGADEGTYGMVQSYLRTVLTASPAFLLNHVLVCFMRNDKAPRLAMAGVLGGSLANVILDYVFIFVMGWGMTGAALATSIAPLVSMCIMSSHFLRRWNGFSLCPVLPGWKDLRSIIPLGLHALVTECAGGIVMAVINLVIYRLQGNTGVAAYGIIANLSLVLTAIFTGLSSGVQPLFCQYHGANDRESVDYLLRLSLASAMLLAGWTYLVLYLNTGSLVSVFNSAQDEQLRRVAENGLRLYFTYMPFMSMNLVFAVYFTSLEYPSPAQVISVLRGAVLSIPLLLVFFLFRSLNGIWLTVTAAELMTATIAVIYYSNLKPHAVYVYRFNPDKKRNE